MAARSFMMQGHCRPAVQANIPFYRKISVFGLKREWQIIFGCYFLPFGCYIHISCTRSQGFCHMARNAWPGSLGICNFCEMMNYYKWEVCSEKNMYTNSHYFLICFLISSGFRRTVSVSPANEHEKADLSKSEVMYFPCTVRYIPSVFYIIGL